MTPFALLTTALLLQLPVAPPEPAAQARQIGVRMQFDQTYPVTQGMRVEVNDCVRDVVVSTWERDAVRVRATQSLRTPGEPQVSGQVLRIDASSRAADFQLTVPSWIGLVIAGRNCVVDIENVTGTVRTQTVEGHITLRGLSGAVEARSIEGTITLEGMRGRTEVSTVDGDILINNSQGEIAAETVDGSVRLDGSQATAVEVNTVDGDITFVGILAPSGHYLFATHFADIKLWIPENSSATFGIQSSELVASDLAWKPDVAAPRGRRVVYTLGSGSAQVDVECFEGHVEVRKGQPPRK